MRTAATRTRRGAGWVAGVVAILMLGGLVVITAVAFVPSPNLPANPAGEYAAAPGSTQRLQVDQGEPATAENGISDGNSIALAVPPSVIRNIRPVGPPSAIRWWREAVTPAGPSEAAASWLTLRSATDVGISLHAFYGRAELALEPALLELPADIAPGRRWTSSGSAVGPAGRGDYTNESSARAVGKNCLQVESVTTLRLGSESRRTDVATWCPGQGIVAGTPTLGVPRRQVDTLPTPPDPGEAPAPPDGPSIVPQVVAERIEGGTEPWPRDVDRKRPSVLTADGTLFSVGQTTRDLAAHRPVDGALRARWSGMPAGSVQGLTAVGNTVLVTTSDRRLVAYASSGLRLWSHRLGDIAPDGAAPLGDGGVVLSTVSGDLEAYDVRSGEQRWTAEIPDGATGLPQTIGDTVYVGRKNNAGIAAVDARTGTLRWSNDDLGYEPVGFARDGDTLLAATAPGTLLRVDNRTGESIATAVAGFGARPERLLPGSDPGVSALQTRDGVLLLATASGEPVAELPGARGVAADAGGLGWWVREPGMLRVVDPRGRELHRWPVPPEVADDARILVAPGRIWLVGSVDADLRVVWIQP